MATGDFVKEGGRITATVPSGGITTSRVLVIRSGTSGQIGVSLVTNASAGAAHEVATEGVFELTKNASTTTAEAMAVGATVYYDVADDEITNVASANIPAGTVVETAANTATTVKIKLAPNGYKIA